MLSSAVLAFFLAAAYAQRSPLCKEVSQIVPCIQASQRWEFDPHVAACRPFVGCPGSGNNFNSEQSCQSMCHATAEETHAEITTAETVAPTTVVDICGLPKVRGTCRALFQRYHYNQEQEVCELFIYGGCNGNENNFQSKQACYDTCRRRKPTTTQVVTTTVGQTKVAPTLITERSSSSESVDICALPAVRGTCRGVILKWFYNTAHQRCEIFPYSGCNGNSNNFATLADCKEICVQPTKPTSTKTTKMVCPANQPHAKCAKNPCDETECAGHPGAVCKPDYCGGCHARFFSQDGEPVSCVARTQPVHVPNHCEDFCDRAMCPPCTTCSGSSGRCGCRPNPEDPSCPAATEQTPEPTTVTTTTAAPTTTAESIPLDLCHTAQCPACTTCVLENNAYGCYQNLTLPGCEPQNPCENVECGDCEKCVPSKAICAGHLPCPQYSCQAIEACSTSEEETPSTPVEEIDARCPAVSSTSDCLRLRQCHFHKDCRGTQICCPTTCGTICHSP